jgi:hypothetical protein
MNSEYHSTQDAHPGIERGRGPSGSANTSWHRHERLCDTHLTPVRDIPQADNYADGKAW